MADYIWTFNIGKVRVGWLRHSRGWILNREAGLYFQFGRLDFHSPSKYNKKK